MKKVTTKNSCSQQSGVIRLPTNISAEICLYFSRPTWKHYAVSTPCEEGIMANAGACAAVYRNDKCLISF